MTHSQSPSLEQRLAAIEARNQNVSADKNWEISLTRKVCIALITYACASLMFTMVLPSVDWYLAACVPVMGYLLSTLGLPWVRLARERILSQI
jgi:hypothetical protein